MTVTVASFQANYPEFASNVRYPVSQITYYLNLAALLLNTQRWGNLLDVGTELFIAHNISLEARAQEEAKSGAIPGMTTGPIGSKSVDKVSISYSTGDAIQPGAGHWNLTIYGTRWVALMRQVGMGPLYVGAGAMDPMNGPAWPGVIY
jgi:hypothetical protein